MKQWGSIVLALLLPIVVQAKTIDYQVSWDDPNNDPAKVAQYNVYVCDQPIPDVALDEFNGTTDPVTCPGNMESFTVLVNEPKATKVNYVVSVPVGSLYLRGDAQGTNGRRSGLSNMVQQDYDYEGPFTIIIRVTVSEKK